MKMKIINLSVLLLGGEIYVACSSDKANHPIKVCRANVSLVGSSRDKAEITVHAGHSLFLPNMPGKSEFLSLRIKRIIIPKDSFYKLLWCFRLFHLQRQVSDQDNHAEPFSCPEKCWEFFQPLQSSLPVWIDFTANTTQIQISDGEWRVYNTNFREFSSLTANKTFRIWILLCKN